jgi:aminoglycoside phosphotransferase (APT) family kinase protein
VALDKTIDTSRLDVALEAWLARRLPDAEDITVSGVREPRGNGQSGESVIFDGAWTTDGRHESRGFVARRAPRDGGIYPTYDFGRELRVMALARDHAGLRVPATWSDPDDDLDGAPVLVMERSEGRVPSDDPPFCREGWVLELTPDEQSTLVDRALETMAAVHAIDEDVVARAGIGRPDLGRTPLDQEFGYWERFYDWAGGGLRTEILDAAFAWAREHRPDDDRASLNWGDARLGNMMFGPDLRVTGVFDWEMATVGSPGHDLGWYLFTERHQSVGFGYALPPGFPTHDETIARYERIAGRRVEHMEFYEVWAGIRGTLIMLRIAQQMIALGRIPADSMLPHHSPSSALLADLIGMERPEYDATGFMDGGS